VCILKTVRTNTKSFKRDILDLIPTGTTCFHRLARETDSKDEVSPSVSPLEGIFYEGISIYDPINS
jgi:hypothetical protein